MHTQSFGATRFVALRLDPGDDVLLSLRAAVQEQGMQNAAILSGVGSLDRYHYHVVKTTNMPPGNTFVQGEGPFDILTVTGLVVNGEVHAHVAFSNTEQAMGGHHRGRLPDAHLRRDRDGGGARRRLYRVG